MSVKLIGLMSTYRDGRLAFAAANSLMLACDRVLVIDGPILDAPAVGDESEFPRNPRVTVRRPTRPYVDDAQKRTALVDWARGRHPGIDAETWYVVLDSDELLIWPIYLRDWVERNAYESDQPLSVGLRLVELDGSVSMIANRVLYAPAIDGYFLSSHVLRVNGQPVTLPNEQICQAGGLPMPPPQILQRATSIVSAHDGNPLQPAQAMTDVEVAAHLSRCRPPLQGEAHILHRSAYRPPTRNIERQHLAEARGLGLK